MATFFWIIAFLAAANAIRLLRNKVKDAQERLNYERHVADNKRNESLGRIGERAGHRRAAEHEWSKRA